MESQACFSSEASFTDSITKTPEHLFDSAHISKYESNNKDMFSFHYLDVKFNNPNSTRPVTPLSWISAVAEPPQELSIEEEYRFETSKAQLTASSKTSARLAGFTMICLVELQYSSHLPRSLLVVLGVITAFLVCIHLLALIISTCILPFIEASREACESPHNSLKFYINLAWFFSTCVGLILFLIGLIFYVKLHAVRFDHAGLITFSIRLMVPLLVNENVSHLATLLVMRVQAWLSSDHTHESPAFNIVFGVLLTLEILCAPIVLLISIKRIDERKRMSQSLNENRNVNEHGERYFEQLRNSWI